MLTNYKNNLLGYFRFIYSVVGNKIIISSVLSIMVSVLDGIGLAMFIPLLQSMGGGSESSHNSMGQLHYFTDAIQNLGFPLSIEIILFTLLILFVVKGIIKFFELNYQASLIQIFMKRVRLQLINNLENLSFRGFTQLDAGTIQNNFIAEVQRMSNAVRFFLGFSQSLLMIITYIMFAILANYQFAILLALCAGITNVLFSTIYKKIKKISNELSSEGDMFNSYLIQAVNYFKYLKATDYIGGYFEKLRGVINKTENLNKKGAFYNAVTLGVREPIILSIVVMVIIIQLNFLGGHLSTIILSLMLFYRALNYLVQIQQHWQNFLHNTGALRSVSNLSASMRSMEEISGHEYFKSLREDIIMKNINLSYGGNNILINANITINHKQTIAFVGESGSGKTTLANIIMGLITPDSGTILIGDIPLENFNLKSFRNKIGYISQDAVIFNDDIFNNITFWAPRNPENLKRFWEVVNLASLTEFVVNHPEKENTKLGDNGILVSGGQKQRISIAREMFKKAEILILDEATSALDSETEFIIQENIEKMHGYYTIIVIAHRLSTIKNADQIYLLEKGKVVSCGNFQNMIKKSEKFKRMVVLQGL